MPCGVARGVDLSVVLNQDRGKDTVAAISRLPEVVELHAITGEADLLLRVLAVDGARLHEFNEQLTSLAGVRRISTALSLKEQQSLSFDKLLRVIADRPTS